MTRSSTRPSGSSPTTTAVSSTRLASENPGTRAGSNDLFPMHGTPSSPGGPRSSRDLAHMQAEALRWSARGGQPPPPPRHRRRRAVRAVRGRGAETALVPLPRVAFRAGRSGRGRKVPPDIHVKVGKALYSVPWRHIGKVVDARERARDRRDLPRGDRSWPPTCASSAASRPTTTTTRPRRSPS